MLKHKQQFSLPDFFENITKNNSQVDCCEIQIGHTVRYIGKNWNGPQQGSIGKICAKRVSTAKVELSNGVKWPLPYSMLEAYNENDAKKFSLA